MSGAARITGRINIDPPIPWTDLYNEGWAHGHGNGDYKADAIIGLEVTAEPTPDGERRRFQGVAIVPAEHETSAYELVSDVGRLVEHFRKATDGTVRTFTGWLHVDLDDGQCVYRVIVDPDGDVLEVHPDWPDDVRYQDSVEPRTVGHG